MSNPLKRLLSEPGTPIGGKIAGLYGLLIASQIVAWAWAVSAFAANSGLLGMALLAYSLGLRHAVDADHIAAIDNATRKLIALGERPIAVGFLFALGHSTVVALASMAVAGAAYTARAELAVYGEIAGIIGTTASALFLVVIAVANLTVLFDIYRAFRGARALHDVEIQNLLDRRGWLVRALRPLLRVVTRAWHLYPIGLLFAFGFETATEISLFGLSAQASGQVSTWSILVFPALFTVGMVLVDTTDGILMLGVYSWAMVNRTRKLWYNITVTAISVLAALVIGGIEAIALVSDRFDLPGGVAAIIGGLNQLLGSLGVAVIAMFLLCWILWAQVDRSRGIGSKGRLRAANRGCGVNQAR